METRFQADEYVLTADFTRKEKHNTLAKETHLVGALLESRISVIDIYERCARAAESLLVSFKMHRSIPASSSLSPRVRTLASVFLTFARVFQMLWRSCV